MPMKKLTLYLCEWRCKSYRERTVAFPYAVPVTDVDRCDCGAADRNILILKTRNAATNVSYFNAAEGDWSREREGREAANAEFKKLTAECEALEIDWQQGESYLI